MSDDLRDLTDFFKDRIDELMVLEKRADERADHLSQTAKNCVESNQAEIKQFLLEMNSASHTIKKIDGTTEKLTGYLHFCETHVKLTLFLFFGSIILALCVGIGTYFWYRHVAGQVEEAKLELAQANVKLRDKPIFLSADNSMSSTNGDYVRVVPNTEGTLTHPNGKPYPGVYAEVWHRDDN